MNDKIDDLINKMLELDPRDFDKFVSKLPDGILLALNYFIAKQLINKLSDEIKEFVDNGKTTIN